MKPKKPKKKNVHEITQSTGPLPLKIAGQYDGLLLVFSDASAKGHGGLAAVLFDEPESEPIVVTRTVPSIGSNEMELQAALFGLLQAERLFPHRQLALFTDNSDAAIRLIRAKEQGLDQDQALAHLLPALDIRKSLAQASIRWIKGHSSCRGNTLADTYARNAAVSRPGSVELPGDFRTS